MGKTTDIHSLIKQNKTSEALDALNRLVLSKPSRELWISISELSRQLGNPSIGMRTLHPAVHGEGSHPTDAEKIEYACTLICLGAIDEANTLLGPISSDKSPDKLFAQGLAFVETYHFREAITPLTTYIRNAKLDEKQRAQGRLLLAKALLETKSFTETAQCLPEPTLSQECRILWVNLEIARGNYEEAKTHIKKLDEFNTQLWLGILDLRQSKGSPQSQELLKEVRKEAFLKKQWEALRLCDLHEGLILKDEKVLTHLIHGSPFSGYRSYVEAQFGRAIHMPAEYFWQPRGAKGVGVTFDLNRGLLDNGKASLKVGQTLHRLLVCLCSDFYRPVRMASLHAEVFPKATFDPGSSPTRVHQVVKRLRQWIEGNSVPLMLESEVGIYQVVGTGPCRIRLSAPQSSKNQDQLIYQKLLDCFAEQPFSSQQVAQAFHLSTRSARRVLSKLVSHGLLETFGSGTKTRYSKPRLKAAA